MFLQFYAAFFKNHINLNDEILILHQNKAILGIK